jgi:hypothetical protein
LWPPLKKKKKKQQKKKKKRFQVFRSCVLRNRAWHLGAIFGVFRSCVCFVVVFVVWSLFSDFDFLFVAIFVVVVVVVVVANKFLQVFLFVYHRCHRHHYQRC